MNFPEGLGVALVTPFLNMNGEPTGAIDFDAFERLVRHVIDGGADYIVALGSTGEAATISDSERREIVRLAVKTAGTVPVVVGTGHNSTMKAVELTRMAKEDGARAALVVSPYYNKPQPEGIIAHFRAVAALGLPLIAYNVPGRTGINMPPAVIEKLWEIPGIIALKESSGNISQMGELLRITPKGKYIVSGDDGLALPSIAMGARGLISVAGNLYPERMAGIVKPAMEGQLTEAGSMHYRMLPFMDAIFRETNPVPIKAALGVAGIGNALPRLPLVEASPETRRVLAELMEQYAM